MILVDSSVWIDFFRGVSTPQVERLDELLGSEIVATGDLVLTEVLQGFRTDRDFDEATAPPHVAGDRRSRRTRCGDPGSQDFRSLRALGVTVRKTIDAVIATRCIESRLALLYSDRDFEPFVRHLGLRSAMART